jgi:hypothetical protein
MARFIILFIDTLFHKILQHGFTIRATSITRNTCMCALQFADHFSQPHKQCATNPDMGSENGEYCKYSRMFPFVEPEWQNSRVVLPFAN